MHPAMPLAMLLLVFAELVFVAAAALYFFMEEDFMEEDFMEEDFMEALGFGFGVAFAADVLLFIAWAITKTILGL